MDIFKSSFDDVADWCERHLKEQKGREVGMTFGALVRTYGRLATASSEVPLELRAAFKRDLGAKAEKLLGQLTSRLIPSYDLVERSIPLIEPMSMRTNMVYDPVVPPKDVG